MRTKRILIISLIIAVSVLLAGVPAQRGSSQRTTDTNPRTINVTGNGKIYLTPDIAYISIGVHTENKDAAEAVTANNATSKKVSDALTSSI
jgi:uncharacterized protein YggE